MKITKTKQPPKPREYPDAPDILDPVFAQLDVPVYYVGDGGPIPVHGPILCTRLFASTVLEEQEAWALEHGFGICHIGVTVQRPARKANGQPIIPKRWSNHAKGNAEDFKGIMDPEGKFISFKQMKEDCPAKLADLISRIRAKIRAAKKREEIVDEGDWLHVGFFA